jgi:hypothetical protein
MDPPPSVLATVSSPQVLSVEDAVEWENGWILLDRRQGQIHFLNSPSGALRSVGREGPGPGEFRGPLAIALQDQFLWVLNQRGAVLDRFSIHGEFQARRRISGGGCLVGLSKELAPLPTGGLGVLRICPATLPGPGTAWIEGLEWDGLFVPILSLPLGQPGSRRLHLMRQPSMAAGHGRLFLGTWDAPCLAEFSAEGGFISRRCLPDFERPPSPEREKTALEKRLARVTELGLFPLKVPDHLPWYDKAFSTIHGLVVRRIRGPEDRDLVLLASDGGIRILDHTFPATTFVGDQTILAVEELLEGARLTVYRLDW